MEASQRDLGGVEEGNRREGRPHTVEEVEGGEWPSRCVLHSKKRDHAHTPLGYSHGTYQPAHTQARGRCHVAAIQQATMRVRRCKCKHGINGRVDIVGDALEAPQL